MNATSAAAGLPFNPTILRWAREWRQRSLEETAKKLNTRPENIESWESGDGTPTVRQARQLADFYERPFLEFFLSDPPDLVETRLAPDFRLQRGVEDPSETRALKEIQAWAEALRENALDLFASLGDSPPVLPPGLHASLDDNFERVAMLAREASGLSIEAQLAMSSRDGLLFPKALRPTLESLGILVLKDSRITKLGARGLCLFSDPLPVIVFGAESPSAQAFTLAHEFGHVLLRSSAFSGTILTRDDETESGRVESWCNRFAAAYLVPADAVNSIWAKPNEPVAAVGDDLLQEIAYVFKVSRHATLIRLVNLGYVRPEYYWNLKRPQFEEEEKNYKAFGRPKYYGSRFRSSCGDMYTGLVLEAWASGLIGNHNATELMGTKSFKHLEDIRREFTSR